MVIRPPQPLVTRRALQLVRLAPPLRVGVGIQRAVRPITPNIPVHQLSTMVCAVMCRTAFSESLSQGIRAARPLHNPQPHTRLTPLRITVNTKIFEVALQLYHCLVPSPSDHFIHSMIRK